MNGDILEKNLTSVSFVISASTRPQIARHMNANTLTRDPLNAVIATRALRLLTLSRHTNEDIPETNLISASIAASDSPISQIAGFMNGSTQEKNHTNASTAKRPLAKRQLVSGMN